MDTEINIENIPSDETFAMTDFWHRSFNAAGCNPMCHCCHNKIPVNGKFKLSTIRKVTPNLIESVNSGISQNCHDDSAVKAIKGEPHDPEDVIDVTTEVMLCQNCTVELFQKKQLKQLEKGAKAYEEYRNDPSRQGGCFRINGKIIH